MPKTFLQMAQEAQEQVPSVTPQQAKQRLDSDPNALMIDVRDMADIKQTGTIPGAAAISGGMLAIRADQELPPEWRDDRVQDRKRPIIVTCALGYLSAMCTRTLLDMGFEDVSNLEGGFEGWKEAGLPVEQVQG